ncbi:MAG: SlyX family protein [Rhodobacterales bacterium]|nr:SlyX family protein [Rhodobacterales bacterium]
MTDVTKIEERLAHLIRSVDDLSEVVVRQDRDIARLAALVQTLVARELDRDSEAGALPLADQRPPHW